MKYLQEYKLPPGYFRVMGVTLLNNSHGCSCIPTTEPGMKRACCRLRITNRHTADTSQNPLNGVLTEIVYKETSDCALGGSWVSQCWTASDMWR